MRTDKITITEVKNLRDTLQAQIGDLIENFEYETGLQVENEIKIERHQALVSSNDLIFVIVEFKL